MEWKDLEFKDIFKPFTKKEHTPITGGVVMPPGTHIHHSLLKSIIKLENRVAKLENKLSNLEKLLRGCKYE